MVIEDINQIEDILLNDEGFASYLTHLQEQKQHGMGDIGYILYKIIRLILYVKRQLCLLLNSVIILISLFTVRPTAIGTGKTIQGAPALPVLSSGTSTGSPLEKLPHQHSMPTTGNGIVHHSATVPHSVNVKKTFQLEKVFLT